MLTRASSQQHRLKWRCHCSTGSSTSFRKRLFAKKSSRGLENCWALVFRWDFIVAVVLGWVFMHWLIHGRIYEVLYIYLSCIKWTFTCFSDLKYLYKNLRPASEFGSKWHFHVWCKNPHYHEHQYHSSYWLNFSESKFPFYKDNFKPLHVDWKFLPIHRK